MVPVFRHPHAIFTCIRYNIYILLITKIGFGSGPKKNNASSPKLSPKMDETRLSINMNKRMFEYDAGLRNVYLATK